MTGRLLMPRCLGTRCGIARQIEVERAENRHHELRLIAVLEQRVFERRRPADEQAAAPAALSCTTHWPRRFRPISKSGGFRPARQKRFTLAHGALLQSLSCGRSRPCVMRTLVGKRSGDVLVVTRTRFVGWRDR